MQNNQKTREKATKKDLWYRWRIDAGEHFHLSPDAISSRYERSDPDLMLWLNEKIKIRNENQAQADRIKQKIESTVPAE